MIQSFEQSDGKSTHCDVTFDTFDHICSVVSNKAIKTPYLVFNFVFNNYIPIDIYRTGSGTSPIHIFEALCSHDCERLNWRCVFNVSSNKSNQNGIIWIANVYVHNKGKALTQHGYVVPWGAIVKVHLWFRWWLAPVCIEPLSYKVTSRGFGEVWIKFIWRKHTWNVVCKEARVR